MLNLSECQLSLFANEIFDMIVDKSDKDDWKAIKSRKLSNNNDTRKKPIFLTFNTKTAFNSLNLALVKYQFLKTLIQNFSSRWKQIYLTMQ